ncbi:MAG: hypothetical protein JW844_02315 [Candidatus Omnitrophica bacterium]|nr:hypothetical protein [Candidatus Omnitrophota bacterium]
MNAEEQKQTAEEYHQPEEPQQLPEQNAEQNAEVQEQNSSAQQPEEDKSDVSKESIQAGKASEEKLKQQPKKERTPRIKTVNCANCNKLLHKGWWYYRDSKYYCNKRCWKSLKSKAAEEA